MNPADLALPAISPSLTTKPLPLTTSLPQKAGKIPIPRVDVEPIYTSLKSALGDHWVEYKAAINAFLLGNLNQAELTWVLQPLLSPIPSIVTSTEQATPLLPVLQLHNQLLVCLQANLSRDPPPSEVAPWVVATDKPSAAGKNAGAVGASDQAEDRLKREIMALHARDRRRIKMVKPETTVLPQGGLKGMQDYRDELAVKPPDSSAQSAGGLPKTNRELETRRKYVQPLAAETLEFPSLLDMSGRIEQICYDEGLGSGTQGTLQACAELMEQGAEVFIKGLLGDLQSHARANTVDCIQTARFRRQLRKEEDEADRGALQRNQAGLLPVELELQAKRKPLGAADLRLALDMTDPILAQDRFLAARMAMSFFPPLPDRTAQSNGVTSRRTLNGAASSDLGSDGLDADDNELGWQGGSRLEQEGLLSVLDACLATG